METGKYRLLNLTILPVALWASGEFDVQLRIAPNDVTWNLILDTWYLILDTWWQHKGLPMYFTSGTLSFWRVRCPTPYRSKWSSSEFSMAPSNFVPVWPQPITMTLLTQLKSLKFCVYFVSTGFVASTHNLT